MGKKTHERNSFLLVAYPTVVGHLSLLNLEQETVQNKRFILMQMSSHCQQNRVIIPEKGCIKQRDRNKGI